MTVYRKKAILLAIAFLAMVSISAVAQDITFYFSAGDFSGEPDRFGNTHKIVPADAIDPREFGNEALADVFFDEDNLWLKYREAGNVMLVSHAPGFWEDAPEIAMEITVAMAGKYEVIFKFLDSNDAADTGPIFAALDDNDLVMYSAANSERATGGTTPGYPQVGGATSGGMYWYSVSLGEVEADAGGVIRVRVDDVQGDKYDIPAESYVTSTFQGVTLRVIELGGALSEVQISPAAIDWTTDISGNQFRTWPVDEAAYPTKDDWLTTGTRVDGSDKWHTRNGLGPYGPILESFPVNGNDAMPLRTSVKLAAAGTYDVFVSIGDTAAADPQENLTNPNPLKVYPEGGEEKTLVAGDGEFKGTPGYNDYEVWLGTVTVETGGQVNYIIDDDPAYPSVQRSVYLGMRFLKKVQVVLSEFQVSPGVTDLFTDIGGNKFRTWAMDEAAYPNLADWLTINANSNSDNKWNIRQGLGPYGPIIESFPSGGEDCMPLRTSVTFSRGGTYEVYLSIGDTGASDPQENLNSPTPLKFGIEGQDLKTWHANDGTFNGTPGYNDYEMAIGTITVANGETKNFIIDDATDYPNAQRSVYLGLRFVISDTAVDAWSLY